MSPLPLLTHEADDCTDAITLSIMGLPPTSIRHLFGSRSLVDLAWIPMATSIVNGVSPFQDSLVSLLNVVFVALFLFQPGINHLDVGVVHISNVETRPVELTFPNRASCPDLWDPV
ncbi:MAG: hypothetical protein ACXADY_26600 [Candidatus Hodarchaeales archaeon]